MQPVGYIHGAALLEAMEYCANQIEACGHKSILSKNRLINNGINVIFGTHVNPEQYQELPKNVIIFNTEQLPEKSLWVNNEYQKILLKNFIWDYSKTNYHLISHENKALIEFYYDEKLQRLKINKEKKWDLIFYGSINERRKKILENLEIRGIRIKTIFGVYGYERDSFIEQSRAVLNLHFYDSQILEQIRIFYPLINKIPVISENFLETSAPDLYRSFLFTPENQDFGQFVSELLADDVLFQEYFAAKFNKFEVTKNNNQFKDSLLTTLKYFEQVKINFSDIVHFKKINLGSGKDYRTDCLNIDLKKEVLPDLVLDLSEKLNFPILANSDIRGLITLNENQIEEIIANDVLEHVSNLEMLMSNCLILLKNGGKFIINVPYELSYGAWQDPTHVRAFNQNSWLYYTDWFWYLGWFDYKFDLVELKYNLSKLGKEMFEEKINQEKILETPRAIDSMKLILVKRETTPEEKSLARSFSSEVILKK